MSAYKNMKPHVRTMEFLGRTGDNPDKDFISAMFTSNDLQSGERLSLEVMYEEINIYIPMNPIIEKNFRKSILMEYSLTALAIRYLVYWILEVYIMLTIRRMRMLITVRS